MTEVQNCEIARVFYEIAALLEARQESRFRIRAYQRAAQTLETLSEDVAAVARRGGLAGDLPAHTDWSDGRHPHVDILVHPTGRRIGTREPYDVDLDAVFATAKRHGKALAISTDTHGLSELDHIDLGITTARRAWIGPAQVLNTRSLDALLAWTRR
jgi:hypothetical protein